MKNEGRKKRKSTNAKRRKKINKKIEGEHAKQKFSKENNA